MLVTELNVDKKYKKIVIGDYRSFYQKSWFHFKITLEFRHKPVFNSVPYTIYTGLTNCAKFQKNRWAGKIYKMYWLYAGFYLAYRSPLNLWIYIWNLWLFFCSNFRRQKVRLRKPFSLLSWDINQSQIENKIKNGPTFSTHFSALTPTSTKFHP